VYATGAFVSCDGINGLLDLTTFEPIGHAEVTDRLTGRDTSADGTTFSFHSNEHILVMGTPPSPKLDFFKAHCN
jgi:hypothetical protein